MTVTPLLSAMNCSLRAPMTFSIEVEPLVDTLPERVAGASVCALLSVLVSAGVSVLEPQPVRAARLKARVKINASVFFMFVFLFYLIFGFSPFHIISVPAVCKRQKTNHVKSMSNHSANHFSAEKKQRKSVFPQCGKTLFEAQTVDSVIADPCHRERPPLWARGNSWR